MVELLLPLLLVFAPALAELVGGAAVLVVRTLPRLRESPHARAAAECAQDHLRQIARSATIACGVCQIGFQLILIMSGNLSFLNWLTIAPALWTLDDQALSFLFGTRAKWRVAELQAASAAAPTAPAGETRRVALAVAGVAAAVMWKPTYKALHAMWSNPSPLRADLHPAIWNSVLNGFEQHAVAITAAFGALVVAFAAHATVARPRTPSALPRSVLELCVTLSIAVLSVPVVTNMLSPTQRMLASYDWLKLVR